MVASIYLPMHNRMDVHRLANPRPVELAQPPAAASPAGAPAAVAGAPPSPLIGGDTFSQLLGIQPDWIGGASAFAAAKAAGAYGLASMPEVTALTPVVPKFAYEEVSGMYALPGEIFSSDDPAGAMTEFLRGQVSDAREAARREQAISDQAGVEVRLAYDPNAEGAVVLYPGDEGYGEVKGARAMFERMPWDLQKMGEKLKDYRDLLQL